MLEHSAGTPPLKALLPARTSLTAQHSHVCQRQNIAGVHKEARGKDL